MSDAPARARAAAPAPRRKRRWRWLAALAAVGLVALLALWLALPPERMARLAITRLADANGLEVTIGDASLALRGEPTLVVRDVVVRDRAGGGEVLRAGRALLALPWSTLRDRGAAPRITRIELDAPVLDVAALLRWIAARPPADTPATLPVLTRGLAIRDGLLLLDGGAKVESLAIDLPRFAAGLPLRAQVAGRYAGDGIAAEFDLALALQRAAATAGLGLVGRVTTSGDGWSLPAQVHVSGPMRVGDDGVLRLQPARIALGARWRADGSDLPFALGLHGPLRIAGGGVAIAPLRLALRGDDPRLPVLDAGGRLAFGDRLLLDLDGRLAAWPKGWPALPPPLSNRAVPAAVALGYLGDTGLGDPLRLRVAREGARFDGTLRLREMLAWIDAGANGSPLPPLRGRIEATTIEISGAMLHGVEVEFVDDDAPGDPEADGQRR